MRVYVLLAFLLFALCSWQYGGTVSGDDVLAGLLTGFCYCIFVGMLCWKYSLVLCLFIGFASLVFFGRAKL